MITLDQSAKKSNTCSQSAASLCSNNVPAGACRSADSIIWTKIWKESMSKKNLERELKQIESIFNIAVEPKCQPRSEYKTIRRLVEEKENEIREIKAVKEVAKPENRIKNQKQKLNAKVAANIEQPLISRPQWLPDGSASECTSCKPLFLFQEGTIVEHVEIFCFKCNTVQGRNSMS